MKLALFALALFSLSATAHADFDLNKLCGVKGKIDERFLPWNFPLALEAVKNGAQLANLKTTGIFRVWEGKVLEDGAHPSLKIRSNISNEIYTFETDLCGLVRLAADPAVRSLQSGLPQ